MIKNKIICKKIVKQLDTNDDSYALSRLLYLKIANLSEKFNIKKISMIPNNNANFPNISGLRNLAKIIILIKFRKYLKFKDTDNFKKYFAKL